MLDYLKKAISSDDHSHNGWHAAEICEGLANLAMEFQNLKNVVSARHPFCSFRVTIKMYFTRVNKVKYVEETSL